MDWDYWLREIIDFINNFFWKYDCDDHGIVGQTVDCRKSFKSGNLALLLIVLITIGYLVLK